MTKNREKLKIRLDVKTCENKTIGVLGGCWIGTARMWEERKGSYGIREGDRARM